MDPTLQQPLGSVYDQMRPRGPAGAYPDQMMGRLTPEQIAAIRARMGGLTQLRGPAEQAGGQEQLQGIVQQLLGR